MDHQQRAACDWQRMIDIRRFFRMHIAVEGERQYKRRKQDNGRENQACQDRIIFSETIQVIIGEVGGVCVREMCIRDRVYTDAGIYGDGEAGMAYGCLLYTSRCV